ncbi:MAG: fatty acid desaturase [Pseudomonadota bacterium]
MDSFVQDPNASKVRSNLPESAHKSKIVIGVPLFLLLATIYGTIWYFCLSTDNLLLKFVLGIITGQAIGSLFVIGHDAAHGSLTGSPKLDRFIGMLAFLPSLHPICTWEVEHNAMHHYRTNLKGHDPVYPPMTLEEFSALSPFQKRLHRFYRSLSGFGFFYLFDIWWPMLIMRRSPHSQKIPMSLVILDFTPVALFFVFQVAMCWYFASTPAMVAWNLLLALTLPFLVWNYVMVFITIQNHTHPSVKWFDNRDEWNFYRVQVAGTVHTVLPPWLDFVFNRVFHHTAHHVDQKIPVYRLVESQKKLEANFNEDVKVVLFSLSEFRRVLYECQLYDYRNHKWSPFPKT